VLSGQIGDRVAVGLVADQDAAEVVARLRVERFEKRQGDRRQLSGRANGRIDVQTGLLDRSPNRSKTFGASAAGFRRHTPLCVVVHDSEVVISSKDQAEHVYQTEHEKLWRSLVGFTGSREQADDTVSEAFAQLIVRGDEVRDPRAWVWKAAFQIAAGELQRRGRLIAVGSERSYDMPEPLLDVLRALTHLGPKQRLAVVLHDYADRPTQEIAGILGVTRATVYAHLSQGRAKLRKLLEVSDV
jgi:RNA polymerase sigma-70 factor, ECF subfamily